MNKKDTKKVIGSKELDDNKNRERRGNCERKSALTISLSEIYSKLVALISCTNFSLDTQICVRASGSVTPTPPTGNGRSTVSLSLGSHFLHFESWDELVTCEILWQLNLLSTV